MRFPSLVFLAALCVLTGCRSNFISTPSPQDPVSSAVFRFNYLEARSYADLYDVQEAFDAVMTEQGFTRTRIDRAADTVSLTYRGEGDVGVQVKLKSESDYTNLRIRYRMLGDEYQSRRILEGVVEHLAP